MIDWDEVSLADQADDLAAVSAGYGDALLAEVVSRVAGAEDRRALITRVLAIRGTFALLQALQALQALRDGDREELDDGLRGYG